jgi:Fe-S-cluster containining protein
MFKLDEANAERFRSDVLCAAGRAEVRDAIAEVYRDLEQQIHLRKPRCDASGRCCRFEEFGHRLFVTTIELATFWYNVETGSVGARLVSPESGTREQHARRVSFLQGACPFQQLRLCSVHEIRPFGCRIFFCDPASNQWQKEQYEQFHGRLKRLHDELDVPYFYVEWREALRAINLGADVGSAACTLTANGSSG